MTRIRFSFARHDALKHISHLDMMRLFQRALRRSDLPLVYSEGYNPHLRFNLALPLPVNVTASEEYGEIFLSGPVTVDYFAQALREQIPEGLVITGAKALDHSAPLLPSLISAALYRASLQAVKERRPDFEQYQEALKRLMARDEILTARNKKKHKKQKKQKKGYVNVRPFIFEAYFSQKQAPCSLELKMLLQTGNRGGVSPFFIIESLEKEINSKNNHKAHWELHREKLYQGDNQFLQPVSEGM